MKTFQSMGLPEALLHTLTHMQFNDPTPIQAEAIPLALEGKDILGTAQTGTGKTGAFGIPLVAKLMTNPNRAALVITPTRELATQIMTQLKLMLGKRTKIKTALLIGGDPLMKQFRQLRNDPQLIVGTPGRINDHLNRGNIELSYTDFLVLDETDRMLDMNFTSQIDSIIEHMPTSRQVLLFAATLPNSIITIAKKYLNNPARVTVGTTSAPAINIKQDILRLNEADKHHNLVSQLDERKGSVIVFVKTKSGTEKLMRKLLKEGHSVNCLHGDLRQKKRDQAVASFRKQDYRILVATDVAARGLDIPHIEHVINYDLPQCAEDYIHRIGRTARAGAKGFALNFITPADKSKWQAISNLLKLDTSKAPINRRNKKKSFKSQGSSDFVPFRKSKGSGRISRGN